MSDFLAEMEARQRRAARTSPPLLPIFLGLVACLIGSVVLTVFFLEDAKALVAGGSPAARTAMFYLRAAAGGLVIGGAIGALIYFAVVQNTRPKWGPFVIGGLTAVTLALTLGFSALGLADENDNLQRRRAASGLQQMISGFLEKGLEADANDTRPRATGEAGEVEQALRETFTDILLAARRYNTDMKALGLQDLSARELGRSDLSDVIGRILRAKLRTSAYRDEVIARVEGFREKINASHMSPESKRQAIAAFDAGFDRSRDELIRGLDLQMQLLDLTEQQVRFLKRRKGTWAPQNGVIAFSNRRDMDTFNATAAQMQAVSAEIVAFRAGQKSKMQGFERQLGEEAAR